MAVLPAPRRFPLFNTTMTVLRHRSSSTSTSIPPPPALPLLLRRPIHIFRDVAPLRQHRRALLLAGESVGLVPTMGALHAGHLALVRRAAAENARVIVSIYVNPTQFGVHEDLASYPKTWDADLALLETLDAQLAREGHPGRVDAVFAPTSATMYPTLPPDSTLPGVGSFVTISPLGQVLEGASRPVFFRGVATVCMKLFNIVAAERVYFGQKDAQQTVVIRRLVRDFHLPTAVVVVPTEREPDGMAMSSRNVYLGARRRTVGLVLRRALLAAEAAYVVAGRRGREEILAAARTVAEEVLRGQSALAPEERALFEVDYISLADPDSLDELEQVDGKVGALLSGAVKMLPLEAAGSNNERLGLGGDQGPVRLIDNILLMPK